MSKTDKLAKPAVPANVSLVEWPQDSMGVASKLKAELIRTAGRVNGDEDKARLALAVIEVGVAHLKARFKAQVAERAITREAAVDRAAREELLNAQRLNQTIKVKEAELASLKGNL